MTHSSPNHLCVVRTAKRAFGISAVLLSILAPGAAIASEKEADAPWIDQARLDAPAEEVATSPLMQRIAPAPLSLRTEVFTIPRLEGLTADETWVDIDLVARRMTVFNGHEPAYHINHLAIGKAGASDIRMKGSAITPIGVFRIDRVNPLSRFRYFFGIDYPNARVADEALATGAITQEEHQYILDYRAQHGIAPHTTPLGGLIGIHGIGSGSPAVHQRWDWTEGCVAVTNAEALALRDWLTLGDRVVIRQ